MAIIKKGLFLVLEKFPDQKEEVKRLFRDSETFQAMCDDYLKSAKAMQYWSQVESDEAPARREEYRLLKQELEEEILRSLNEWK